MSEIKNFISRAILAGAIMALVVFAVSLFLPKKWQVSGKIVVFPSGKPVSASQNLSEEVGNTAWIVNSDTFQKNNFGDLGADFSGAEVLKNSSVVLVKFRSPEENIKAVEDLIVKIPSQVAEYARDLYDGSPFKYKMVSDPEISVRPVKPAYVKNSSWGFVGGLILFFLYWLFVESFVTGKREVKKEEEISSVFPISPPIPMESEEPALAEPISYEPIPEPEPMPEPMPEIFPEEERKEKKPVSQISPAPDNLPIAEAPATSKEYHEPSDEEVKERLNRLMRGEL